MTTTVIHRADRVLLPDAMATPGWLEIGSGQVLATGPGAPPRPADVDHGDATLSPGLVDIHCHGGGGFSFTDGVEPARGAQAAHRRAGTVATVASLVSAPIPVLATQCAELAALVEAGVLAGIHLEGPWLNPRRRGAHDPRALTVPTPADIETLVGAARGTLRMVTLAPELVGARDAVSRLVASGVSVAVGHSDADEEQTRRAIDAGASVATHLFNAMRPLTHRSPGIIGACLASPQVTVELIADGVHVAPTVTALAARSAVGGFALVTDAIAAAGRDDGRYVLGGLEVEVADGVARLAGSDTLAGSSLLLLDAVRHAVRQAGLTLEQALRAATRTPASALRLAGLGIIAPGVTAPLIVLDDDLRLRSVLDPRG
jgi:N-acetylglucosamine-6-phosphate deacetylase